MKQNPTQPQKLSADLNEPGIETCLQILKWLAENPAQAGQLPKLGEAIARAYKRIRKQRRIDAARARKAEQKKDAAPSQGDPAKCCYICRSWYRETDAMYPLLCPECAQKNRTHRNRRVDLTGRTALVTGARIKVGYQTTLKLLRDGAEVIATTRFPRDAARRYSSEVDFDQWKDRLRLYALDLRFLPTVHAFADHLCSTLKGLNIVINNAAQTIRRPPEFFRPLIAHEGESPGALPPAQRMLLASDDWEGDSVDSHTPQAIVPHLEMPPVRNSWLLPLEEVQAEELAEVMVINSMAPFILCSRLEPLMRRCRFEDRHIVNVTSAEGQFARADKMPEHPHTNMAKASLNMLTRTAAARCAASGIYMNSVDPGWITHMVALNPAVEEDLRGASGFVPPLDATDGAARIYDPIIRGVEGQPVWGELLKDYQSVSW